MELEQTALPGVFIIKPKVFSDERGFFYESYNKNKFEDATGLSVNFVQDNHSKSKKGTLRGLHMQVAPHAQDKLVRVTRGSVYDVAVDVDPTSPNFGTYVGVELSEKNALQLFIRKGYAHGFLVLEDDTEFQYKCSDFYHPETERSVLWSDPDLGIPWPESNPILSEKDANAKRAREIA